MVKKFFTNLNHFLYLWRHINTFIDYASYKNKKIRIQKLYIEDYNPLNMYKELLKWSYKYKNRIKLLICCCLFNTIKITLKSCSYFERKTNYRTKGLESDNIYSINRIVYNLLFVSSSIKLSKNTFYTDKEVEIIERDNILSIDEDSIPVLKEITIKFNTDCYNDSLVNKTYITTDKEDKSSLFLIT